MTEIQESAINIISEGTQLEGEISFDQITRVHGTIKGKVKTSSTGVLILSETSVVEGSVEAETLIVDGFVRGDLHVKRKVTISGTGRVIGNIYTPSLSIEFGAYFEGKSLMNESPKRPSTLKPQFQSA